MCIISFVAAITFVKKKMSCFIAGRLLHYFVLTSFSWMLIQAIILYRAIVAMTTRLTDNFYFKFMSGLAWGEIFSFYAYCKLFFKNKELYYGS